MHAQIAPDAMAGAVVVIEPLLPERAARKGVQLRACRPFRKAREGERDMPLKHAREAVAHLVAGLADRDRAGDVGRAIEILRAGVEEVERSGFEAALGLGHRAVMHDRAVWAGAGDRREAQIAEQLALAPKGFEPVAGGDLAELAFGRLAREPGEKAGDRGAVAAVRGAGAVKLDRVLAGLWQQARIGGAMNPAACLRQPVENPRR